MKGFFVHGITCIVNMIGQRSPFVLIKVDMFEHYINNLKKQFPDDIKNKQTIRKATQSPFVKTVTAYLILCNFTDVSARLN